jgi:type II secretory pathway component GspD/PulD (secretin)
MQSGRPEAVAAGSTLFGRGQSTRSATAYRQENVGTLVSLTPRVAGDAVVMEISVEKSQLRPAAREPEETPAGMEQLVAKTTLKIERGMTVVVGGSSISAAGTTTTQVVLASAEIVGKPAQPNEDKTKARPAEDAVELRVFELHNAMAETAATIVIKSFKAKTTPISVTIDERSNLLIVRGPRSVMAAIEALLSRIDRK